MSLSHIQITGGFEWDAVSHLFECLSYTSRLTCQSECLSSNPTFVGLNVYASLTQTHTPLWHTVSRTTFRSQSREILHPLGLWFLVSHMQLLGVCWAFDSHTHTYSMMRMQTYQSCVWFLELSSMARISHTLTSQCL
jgi:hypothetical protein